VATNIVMDTRNALLRLHSVRETPHALDRSGGGAVADSAETDAFATVLAADIVDAACARGVISRRAADVVIETASATGPCASSSGESRDRRQRCGGYESGPSSTSATTWPSPDDRRPPLGGASETHRRR
jgi:hypothetical protein